MYIVIAEDDKLQAATLVDGLRGRFPIAEIEVFRTERQFRASFESIATRQPDVVILDIMMKWTEPSWDAETPPPDVVSGKFYRAGFRCQKMLEGSASTKNIPVILYSVVDFDEFAPEAKELPSNARLLPKEPSLDSLVGAINELTRRGKAAGSHS
jgi:CheY-like chemotaxis protein